MHTDMPKVNQYIEKETSLSDHLKFENEKDLTHARLKYNSSEQAFFDSIIGDFELKVPAENPLLRDTYKTPLPMKKNEKEIYDYIRADRALKSNEGFSAQELALHRENKGMVYIKN